MEFDSHPVKIPTEDVRKLQDAFLAAHVEGIPNYELPRLYTDGMIYLAGVVVYYPLPRHVALDLPLRAGGHQQPFIITKDIWPTAVQLSKEMDGLIAKYYPN